MDLVFFDKVQKLWNRTREGILEKDDAFKLHLHKNLFEIFHVGNFYYWIFDVKNLRFNYLSPEIKNVLGYNAEDVDLIFLCR